MTAPSGSEIMATLSQIPCGLFVLTAAHNGMRSGLLTRWVQPCSTNPPHVMVAIERGMAVEPLIRDSHSFALCQIAANDRLLRRAFATPPERGDDPFVALPAAQAPSGSPIISRALSYLDCELVRHVVLEADYRLYVGLIHHGAIVDQDGQPAIEVGENGQSSHSGSGGTNGATPRDHSAARRPRPFPARPTTRPTE